MCSLCFLSVVSLNGLGRAFSDLAKLTRADNSIPRIRFMYLIICGALWLLRRPAHRDLLRDRGRHQGWGAHWSVCGVGRLDLLRGCFLRSVDVAIPSNAYAPLLLAIGVILFLNTNKIDWTNPLVAFPAFAVQFIVPFTSSILNGVFIGWILYLMLNFVSFSMYKNGKYLLAYGRRYRFHELLGSDRLPCIRQAHALLPLLER